MSATAILIQETVAQSAKVQFMCGTSLVVGALPLCLRNRQQKVA
jgi:hypothetical protein